MTTGTRLSDRGPVSASAPYRQRPWFVFVLSFVGLFALSATWVFASPLMSVPDEPSHAIKAAAVVRGELGGVIREGERFPEVIVPEWVALSHELPCFAFQPDVAPSCVNVNFADTDEPTPVVTSAGAYNPVYYAVVGLPSLVFEGTRGFYIMRLVSAALACLLLASMFQSLSRLSLRRWTITAAVVAITPMVLYLNAGINPNSLEIAATGAVFASLTVLLERAGQGRQSLTATAWFTVSAALLANARGLSLVFLLLAVVAALLLYPLHRFWILLKQPLTWIGAGVIAAATGFALWWIATTGSLTTTAFGGVGTSFNQGIQVMVDRTFEYASALVGIFGWLDTPAPGFAVWVFGTMVGVLLIGAIAIGRGRYRLVAVLTLLALFVLPPIFQAAIVTESGYIWQGRYNLPLFVLALLASGMALDAALGRRWNALAQRALVTTVIIAGAAHLATLIWVLRRYVTGIRADQFWLDMLRNPQWQPPYGWITWGAIFTVALVAAGYVLLRPTAPGNDRTLEGDVSLDEEGSELEVTPLGAGPGSARTES